MNEIICKIAEGFTLDWDIENLTKDFPTITTENQELYSDPDGKPHWQYYTSGICFARNFYRNYRKECFEIYLKLVKLQKSLINNTINSPLISDFLNHTLLPNRVNIIKVPGGSSVEPHTDISRNICINIGIRNSNLCTTYIRQNQDNTYETFWNDSLLEYVMNDGDVYIVSIKNFHAVRQNTNLNLDRFLITYTMSMR